MERIADDEELRDEGHDAYFDAGIAIACGDVLYALARGKSVFGDVQQASARNLGKLITDTTGDTYAVDAMPDGAERKLHQVIALALLMRNTEDYGMYGVPSPPATHAADYVEADGTTSHHMYAVSPRRAVPIHATRWYSRNEILSMQGVLPIMLGSLLVSSVKDAPTIFAASKAQGHLERGQRWLVNEIARGLGLEAEDARDGLEQPMRRFLNASSRHVCGLVAKFDISARHQPDAQPESPPGGPDSWHIGYYSTGTET